MHSDLPADPLSIRLSVSYQGLWWQIDGERERPERWIVTATAESAGHVGDISLAIADLTVEPELFDVAILGDWVQEFLAEAVADPIHGTLVPELEQRISAGPAYLVVLRRVTLAEPWRGHGLGSALTAGALRIFARYTRFAACRVSPAAFAAPSQISAGQASRGAAGMLEAIGFRRWRDVHIVDVRDPSLLDARNRVRERWQGRS